MARVLSSIRFRDPACVVCVLRVHLRNGFSYLVSLGSLVRVDSLPLLYLSQLMIAAIVVLIFEDDLLSIPRRFPGRRGCFVAFVALVFVDSLLPRPCRFSRWMLCR